MKIVGKMRVLLLNKKNKLSISYLYIVISALVKKEKCFLFLGFLSPSSDGTL